jgi:LPS sulfotransferase NodH
VIAIRPFVIVSHARSGSNLLVRSLNAHPEVLCHGEILKPTEKVENLAKMGASPEDLTVLAAHHARDTGAFAREYFRIAASRGWQAAGFKLFYYHAREDGRGSVWDLIQRDDDLHVLHLYRENLFDAYLSRQLATTTNVWVQPVGRPGSDYDARITVDCDDFLRYHRSLSASIADAREGLPGARTFTLTYDELTGDYPGTIKAACGFLGVGDVEASPPLSRQRTRPKWEYVENAEEVREFLRGRGMHALV